MSFEPVFLYRLLLSPVSQSAQVAHTTNFIVSCVLRNNNQGRENSTSGCHRLAVFEVLRPA